MAEMQQTMLVQVHTDTNNNKFYEVTYDPAAGTVTTRWGRVGATGQSKTIPGGENQYRAAINKKMRGGYSPVDVVSAPTRTVVKENLRQASHKGLAAPGFESDPRLKSLVDLLVDMNAHEIEGASGGKIKVVDGQVTTPLGLLSQHALDKAGAILGRLESTIAEKDQVRLLEEYLTLVPQKVGARVGWHDAFLTPSAFTSQRTFLDQLSASLDFSRAQAVAAGEDDPVEMKNPFKVRLLPVEPTDPRFSDLSRRFTSSRNSHHPTANLRLAEVFAIDDADTYQAFKTVADRIGNVNRMWHGTRVFNVLSILSKGLYCPPANAKHVTARMFGDGVYFSTQSTKSLNYSYGMWGGGGQGRDATCFMLSVDVAMGKEYHPTTHSSPWNDVHSRYDSINVKAGTAGVINHEAIVWRTEQINPRYLCKFTR